MKNEASQKLKKEQIMTLITREKSGTKEKLNTMQVCCLILQSMSKIYYWCFHRPLECNWLWKEYSEKKYPSFSSLRS